MGWFPRAGATRWEFAVVVLLLEGVLLAAWAAGVPLLPGGGPPEPGVPQPPAAGPAPTPGGDRGAFTRVTVRAPAEKLTRPAVDRVRDGMTLAEVAAALDAPAPDTPLAGRAVVTWEGGGRRVSVTFADGRAAGTSQQGLD